MIRNLPNSIGDLTELRKIDLSNNKLKSLPETISNLKNLQKLNIYSNPLQNTKDSFTKSIINRMNKKYQVFH